MKLKAYFNPSANIVEIRLTGDAAPAAPFVLLGDIVHETPDDNASGMQTFHISHALKAHIDELLYTKRQIQSTQNILIRYHTTVKPLESISIDSGKNTLEIGEENTITVRLLPAGATLTRPLTIEPTRLDLVEVISNTGGVLKYKGKAMGDLMFNVKVDYFSTQIPVRIEPVEKPATPVTGVTVSPTTASLAPAATRQLTPTIVPADADVKTVTYSSSAPAVATVSSTGLVTAVAAGTAVITVTTTQGGFTATSTITVA